MAAKAVIAGGGIVGLATGYQLARRGLEVTILEKECAIAQHQSGHNSGVIHSGLYYTPGSLKATLGVAGALSMQAFAEEHEVAFDICGKLVVATSDRQIPALKELLRRGTANGVPCRLLTPEEAREYEPHVACVLALRVESTGIIDYAGVCNALSQLIKEAGGQIRLGAEVEEIRSDSTGVTVASTAGVFRGSGFVNCGGLHSDRIASMAGLQPEVRIVPFRGEYFELAPDQAGLVRGLIYPVPDPTLPFLGVHLTRMIGGGVHAGPNGVLALSREGYAWNQINLRDLVESAAWPGLWRLGRRFWRTGIDEVARSFSRRRFLASVRELVPELGDHALIPAHAGVRAQALHRDGKLVDDFFVQNAARQVHVLNAPSPAATAALGIARRVADDLMEVAF